MTFTARALSQVVSPERSGQSSPGGIWTEHGGCEKRGVEISCEMSSRLSHGLECDDNMSNAGHRVRVLPVDSEVVILPEDVEFI